MSADKNTTVIIERTANGFIARPSYGRDDLMQPFEFMVFQDKGYVSSEREGQPVEATLLGWLSQHFS
jgi:hypothetical protein